LWQGLIDLLANSINFFYNLSGNYGMAIILVTVAIRLILLPLTWSQSKSMRKMQLLQPEIKKLQEKYKNDKQKINEETMKLWKENNVNPAAGCLPFLVQLPVLWAFFIALREFDFIGAANFLWIQDLSLADPLYLLPILAGLTTYWQTKMTTSSSADSSQQWMVYLMPVFIAWISTQFPAGLSLYWVTSNLFSIAQQYGIMYGERGETA